MLYFEGRKIVPSIDSNWATYNFQFVGGRVGPFLRGHMRTYDDSETRRGERKPIRALDVRSGDEDKSERRQRRCMEEEKDVRVRWRPVRVTFAAGR